MEEKITAYKGFNKDMTCRDYQFEVGKEYEETDASVCNKGFHACKNPLDVLDYYKDIDGRYCIVEQSGKIDRENDGKKQASSRIKIVAEIGFVGLFKAGIEWLKEVTSPEKIEERSSGYYAKIGSSDDSAQIGSSGYYAQIGSSGDSAQIGSSGYSAKIGSSGDSAKIGSSGDYAQIGSSGDYTQIGSTGDYAKIGSSGDYTQIGSTGEDTVICCAGRNSVAKAKVGSWITLAEWMYSEDKKCYVPKCVKTEYVDGDRIKGDTWYMVANGEFTEQRL